VWGVKDAGRLPARISPDVARPKIDSTTERKVRKQLAKGVGILRVAKSLGIGTGTVQRIANELR
jgi:DNA invertase Pin-like site-specific DNA recombinase